MLMSIFIILRFKPTLKGPRFDHLLLTSSGDGRQAHSFRLHLLTLSTLKQFFSKEWSFTQEKPPGGLHTNVEKKWVNKIVHKSL